MLIPIIVLFIVFILIALRQISNARLQILQIMWLRIPLGRTIKLEIWQIMLFGAMAVLLTTQIAPVTAVRSINPDVMLFLFGMFVVGYALEESGYLSYISYRLFSRAKSMSHLLLLTLFGVGAASAFLMNDTLAIVGTPIMLILAKRHGISAKPLLLALCFAVTIGGVMSPIGNPQNFLIATGGNIQNPFLTFFRYLLIPSIINLFVAYLLLKYFYRMDFEKEIKFEEEKMKDNHLARLSRLSLILIISLIAIKIIAVFFWVDIRLTYIALIAAAPILVLSRRRLDIIRNIDWRTLVFFASMFVLMESVWQTGFFQSFFSGADIASAGTILLVSVTVSQFISNVPLVALFLPLMNQAGAGAKELLTLAAGSTIAGNLFILGAASNIIVIQRAEKSNETITFAEFAKIGIPLTIINVFVYWIFLR